MNIRLISSTEADIVPFTDQFLGLKTVFEQAEFPFWVLVDDQTVKGLIVAAKEPRDMLQPASTPFIQVYLFHHDPEAVEQLLSNAETIATDYQAAYLSCIVSADKDETISLLEKAEYSVYDETVKMGSPLDNVISPTTELTFYRTSPEETALVLDNIAASMVNTPGKLLNSAVYNIRQLPPEKLESTLSQMEVILVKDSDNPVGILSLEGPTIGMLGVHPQARGKGYGQKITQWAKHHLAQQGHFRAWLRVSVQNEPALHIFEKEGFNVTERMRYYVKSNINRWQEIPP